MASSKTFADITPSLWDCIKKTSQEQHGTVYSGENQGTATTNTLVGKVVLEYDFEASKDTLRYKIKQKPFLVSSDQIWNGIQDTIDDCNG